VKKIQRLHKLKEFDKTDIEAGRKFVKAYVEFIHYVEPIYEIATKGIGHGHGAEGTGSHEEIH